MLLPHLERFHLHSELDEASEEPDRRRYLYTDLTAVRQLPTVLQVL